MTEEELRADAGDEAALRTVYRTTVAEVFGHLMFRSGGDRHLAEDLMAQTYLHATDRFRHGRGDEVTIAWLKTVAQRRFIDHVRRETRVRRRAERLRAEVAAGSTDQCDDYETQDAVAAALGRLPEDQRLVLILRHVDGMAVGQIASILDRSYKGTESLLSRARAGFRAVYGGET